ncbi:AsnC family transcriptional regulator [Candidatus Woesearchaeota archaeon]|nr:AsnC family transcriptional regulator [Candidatus Woesearchaeota archaeon]
MKLDKKDFKILYELDNNARIPYSKLSKKIGLSQESVRYRINKLVKEEIIRKFFTVIDISKLGFTFYKILLKLHNINEKKMEEITDYLSKNKDVVWLVSLDGNFDIGLVVKVKSILELNNIIEEIDKKFSQYINRRTISINILGEYLVRDYLINKSRLPIKEKSYKIESEEYKLDKIDLKIIQNLAENGRKTAIDIARELSISSDSVIQRKKKLEKEKIITGYNLILNNSNLNQIHFKVLINLDNFSPAKIDHLINYAKSINRIVYIIKTLGEWNYEFDIEVENIDQYKEIVMNLTNKFSTIIRDYNYLIIKKIHKYNLYPE